MTALNQPGSIQKACESVAVQIDSALRKLATVSVYGSSAALFVGLTYGVVQLCYYWPIVQHKLGAIQPG